MSATQHEERTIVPAMANLLGIVFGAALTMVVVGLFRLVTGHVPVVDGHGYYGWIVVLVGIATGIPLHEFLHSIGFRHFGRADRQDISFGFNFKAFAPFVHCSVPVTVRCYRLAAMLPGLVLGVIPLALGIAVDSGQLFAIGYVLLLAAIGDGFLLILLHDLDDEQLVLDHKSKPGFVVITEPTANTG